MVRGKFYTPAQKSYEQNMFLNYQVGCASSRSGMLHIAGKRIKMIICFEFFIVNDKQLLVKKIIKCTFLCKKAKTPTISTF